MTVGFPGTGIGGLFYILVALAMPFRNLWLRLRKPGECRRTSSRLFFLAIGVVAGVFVTGWLLGLMIGPMQSAASSGTIQILSHPKVQNVVRLAALYASLSMLFIILLTVQIARLLVRKKR
jgi:hypothetical protein